MIISTLVHKRTDVFPAKLFSRRDHLYWGEIGQQNEIFFADAIASTKREWGNKIKYIFSTPSLLLGEGGIIKSNKLKF